MLIDTLNNLLIYKRYQDIIICDAFLKCFIYWSNLSSEYILLISIYVSLTNYNITSIKALSLDHYSLSFLLIFLMRIISTHLEISYARRWYSNICNIYYQSRTAQWYKLIASKSKFLIRFLQILYALSNLKPRFSQYQKCIFYI